MPDNVTVSATEWTIVDDTNHFACEIKTPLMTLKMANMFYQKLHEYTPDQVAECYERARAVAR